MNIKFKTFESYKSTIERSKSCSAAEYLNEWLEENPNVEIISWDTCVVEPHGVYITIQYKEKDNGC